MLDPPLVALLAQSIAQVILAPAIRHSEDVTHIHVLQDAFQKIRHPHYHMHPDFATGYTYGQSYYATHERPYAFMLTEVITVLRDNLARHDHEEQEQAAPHEHECGSRPARRDAPARWGSRPAYHPGAFGARYRLEHPDLHSGRVRAAS